jgi:hypothetical protein
MPNSELLALGVLAADVIADADLAAVIRAWGTLPPDVRKMIAGVARLTPPARSGPCWTRFGRFTTPLLGMDGLAAVVAWMPSLAERIGRMDLRLGEIDGAAGASGPRTIADRVRRQVDKYLRPKLGRATGGHDWLTVVSGSWSRRARVIPRRFYRRGIWPAVDGRKVQARSFATTRERFSSHFPLRMTRVHDSP